MFKPYIKGVAKPVFVKVNKGNFLSKTLDVDGSQGFAVGCRLPVREL